MKTKKIIWNRKKEDEHISLSVMSAWEPWNTGATLKKVDTWVPSLDGAESVQEELITLLQLAAEIEHTLLVQYLYTAYSDTSGAIAQTIIPIAIQEMGHLLAVQNLLLIAGGTSSIHLKKSDLRNQQEFKLLPYSLEPVSKNLLAKYVAVEAPPDAPAILAAFPKLPDIQRIAFETAGTTFNPVGGLYEKLFWLFQDNDQPVPGPIMLKPDDDCFLAGRHIAQGDLTSIQELKKVEPDLASWSMGSALANNEVIFQQVFDKADARKLIALISGQGERAQTGDQDPSHFEQFYTAYDGYDELGVTVMDIPANPVTRDNSEFKSQTLIKNPYSVLWLSLFNKLYTSVLLDIHASIFYKQFKNDVPAQFVDILHFAMSRLLNNLTTNVLYKLSSADTGFTFDQAPRCAPTFEIDETFKLSTLKDEVDAQNSAIISGIRDITAKIKADPNFSMHQSKDGGTSADLLDKIEEKYSVIKFNLLTNLH